MQAEWNHSKYNTGQCLIPLVALQVFVNGDVSFCPCSDYDGAKDLSLVTGQHHGKATARPIQQ